MILTSGMADTPFTQAMIDELTATIASGTLTVKYAGPPAREETYQSLDAMIKLLDRMRREVNGGGATYRLGATRKGLGA